MESAYADYRRLGVFLAEQGHDLSSMPDVHEQANLATKRPADLAALRTAWETIDATLLPYA